MVGEDGFARLRTGQVGGKTCRWHVFLHASPSNPSSQRPIHSKKHHPFGWCFLLVGEDGFARLWTGRLAALERPRRSIHFRSASNPSSQRPIPNKNTAFTGGAFAWWGKMDSNHRRHCQQIYSLSPLATREFPHMNLRLRKQGVLRWSWWTDSNPRPADYKSAALPAELHQRFRSARL